jgi:hypothetical protein
MVACAPAICDSRTFPEGAVTMRVRLPKHPFLCNSCVPFQELIYWWFRSNWRFWSILIAHRPFWSFWSISNHFNHLNLFQLFRSILNHFNSFWFILIHFDSFWFILIHFHLFQSILIHLDSDIGIAKTFWWHASHFYCFIMSQPAKMVHDGGCCHLTFASFTPIMQEYDISWLIWEFSDGKVEKQQ